MGWEAGLEVAVVVDGLGLTELEGEDPPDPPAPVMVKVGDMLSALPITMFNVT